jgi:hypothetical protein
MHPTPCLPALTLASAAARPVYSPASSLPGFT